MKSCLRPTDKEDEFFSFVAGDSLVFSYRFLVSLDFCLAHALLFYWSPCIFYRRGLFSDEKEKEAF